MNMTVTERCSINTVLPIARPPDDIKCVRIVQHNMYALCAFQKLSILSWIKIGHRVTGNVSKVYAILQIRG